MTAVFLIAVLWLLFAGSHMTLSSLRLRPRLVAALGERAFSGLYSLLALALFVPLCWLYAENKHAGPYLWYLGAYPVVRWIGYAGMALAFTLLLGGLLTPSPASITGKPAADTPVRGVLRLTRHPTLMALGLFGALHLLMARVNASELVFFAGFPVFVALGARHQDRRKLATQGEAFRRFHDATAFLPLARGGLGAALPEAAVPIGLGVVVAGVLRWLHPGIFGGA